MLASCVDCVVPSLDGRLAEPRSNAPTSTVAQYASLVHLQHAVASNRHQQCKTKANSVVWKQPASKSLHGVVVVFLTAGYSLKRFIFEKAKELGVVSVVIDDAGCWAEDMERDGTIFKFLPVELCNGRKFENCLTAIVAFEKAHNIKVAGICTFCECAITLAAELSQYLGLPGHNRDAVEAARSKYKTRQVMAAAGLPTLRHMLVSCPADLAQAAAHVGFPAIIKPCQGAASFAVMRANNMQELYAAYDGVVAALSKLKIVFGSFEPDYVEEAGSESAGPQPNHCASKWIDMTVVLEEFLDGDEVDCDIVLARGRCVFGCVTDNWHCDPHDFRETGLNCPSLLPKHKQEELLDLGVKTLQAMGFLDGVFHVECKYSSHGARLLEVNARMGGGPTRRTQNLVWGVDLVDHVLEAAVGIAPQPPARSAPLSCVAFSESVTCPATGRLVHTAFMEPWVGHAAVSAVKLLCKAGQRCVAAADGAPTYLAQLMVAQPTVPAALELIHHIIGSLDIQVDTSEASSC